MVLKKDLILLKALQRRNPRSPLISQIQQRVQQEKQTAYRNQRIAMQRKQMQERIEELKKQKSEYYQKEKAYRKKGYRSKAKYYDLKQIALEQAIKEYKKLIGSSNIYDVGKLKNYISERVESIVKSKYRRYKKKRAERTKAVREAIEKQKKIVIVDGQGYSVAPELQDKFAREMIQKGAKEVTTGAGYKYTPSKKQKIDEGMSTNTFLDALAKNKSEIAKIVSNRKTSNFISMLKKKGMIKDTKLSKQDEKRLFDYVSKNQDKIKKIISKKQSINFMDMLKSKGIIKETKLSKEASKFLIEQAKKIGNVISLGSLDIRKVAKRQEKLNREVDNFNKRWNKEITSEGEYKRYLSEFKKLEEKQKDLEKLKKDVKKKWYIKFKELWNIEKNNVLKTEEEKKKALELYIKGLDKKMKKEKKLIESSKSDLLKKYHQKVYNLLKKAKENALKKEEKPSIKLFIVPVDMIPVESPLALEFVGTQISKGAGSKTNIAFKLSTTSKKYKGVATSLAKQSGKKSASIGVGKYISSGVKKRKGSFINLDVGFQTSPEQLAYNVNIIKNSKNVGKIKVISDNIKKIASASKGISKSKRGWSLSKLLKSGKVDDYATITSTFSKKDLNILVGKIGTGKSSYNFAGVIKSLEKKPSSSVGLSQATQLNKLNKVALKRLLTNVNKAILDAEKISAGTKLTKIQKLALARRILDAKIQKKKANLKIVSKKKTKPRLKSKTRTKQEEIQVTKTKLKQKKATRQKIKQKNKAKQRRKQKKAFETSTLQKQKQSQKQRTRGRMKQKQIEQARKKIPKAIHVPTKLSGIRFKRKKKTEIKKKTQRKEALAYNIYAKVKGKYVKVNKYPYRRTDALNLGAYLVDKSLSRTFKLVPVGKTDKIGKPSKKVAGYYSKVKKKFRTYRSRRKKKLKMSNTYIEEKGKSLLDTRGEKKKIQLLSILKRIKNKEKLKRLKVSKKKRKVKKVKKRTKVRKVKKRKTKSRKLKAKKRIVKSKKKSKKAKKRVKRKIKKRTKKKKK